VEVVASLSQGRTAAAQCGLFIHKSVPVIFEPPCVCVCIYIYIYIFMSFHLKISQYFVVRLTVYFGCKTFNYPGKSSVYYVGNFMVHYSDSSSGVSQSVISLYFWSLRRFFSTFRGRLR